MYLNISSFYTRDTIKREKNLPLLPNSLNLLLVSLWGKVVSPWASSTSASTSFYPWSSASISSWAWSPSATFSKVIQKAWNIQSKADYSLFTKTLESSFTTVLLYVDDIILTWNDDVEIKHLKEFLLQHFRIKDLGTLKYFMGFHFLGLNMVFLCLKENMRWTF